MQPGDQSFHSSTSWDGVDERAVATQGTTALRRGAALAALEFDRLDAIALRRISIQAVAVIGLVADQSRREAVEEAVSEDAFEQLALVRRSAFDRTGERRTVIIGVSDDFGPFTALRVPHARPPFLRPGRRRR